MYKHSGITFTPVKENTLHTFLSKKVCLDLNANRYKTFFSSVVLRIIKKKNNLEENSMNFLGSLVLCRYH